MTDIESIDARLTALESRVAALESRAVGDLDGDGDVDDSDIGEVMSNYTGPRPVDLTTPPDIIAAADVNSELERKDSVQIDSNAVVDGDVHITRSASELISSIGGRAKINGRVIIKNDQTERVLLNGLDLAGSTDLRSEYRGIELVLSSAKDKFARDVRIDDCKVGHYDTLVHIEDQMPRSVSPETHGRINFKMSGCILHNAHGSDSHSAGVYLDGLGAGHIDETIIWNVGWTEDGSDPREKRSHCIYAQQFGAPITVRNSILGEASANAIMARRGGRFENLIISGCPLAASIFGGNDSHLLNSAILDQRDIDPDVPSDRRGKTIDTWSLPSFAMRDVVIARRHGEPLNHPVASIYADTVDVQNNTVVAYPSGGDGKLYARNRWVDGIDGNRVIDHDPGVPTFDPTAHLNRASGEAFINTSALISQCHQAVA